jgi:two-component system, NtrC family, response regulator AtoC
MKSVAVSSLDPSGAVQPVADKTPEIVRLLAVSRESAVLRPLWSVGEANSWQLESATNGWGAMERVQSGVTPDLLILDLPRAEVDGLHFLRWLRRLRPELPIIVVCEKDDLPTRRESVRLGARDYILRPVEDQQMETIIKRELSVNGDLSGINITSEDVEQLGDELFFVGASPIMRKLRAQAELLAETDAPVLILGERGSGKQTTGRLIHHLSVRSGSQFAKVNCAALPSDLLELELFGHERKDGTAWQYKAGKLELCNNGTLLLDEICEMPMALQGKLLQVLRTKQLKRPESGIVVGVNVRVLTACSCNLESAISENKLREDLYYRLSAYSVRVPALRERKEEVPLLIHYFMRYLAKQYALIPRPVSPALLEACQRHSWPGNLRELDSFVKRYLLAGGKELAEGRSFPVPLSTEEDAEIFGSITSIDNDHSQHTSASSDSSSLKSLVQSVKLEAEKNAIGAALEKTGWNRKAAARLLKVSYRTLLYKIEQHKMKGPEPSLVI